MRPFGSGIRFCVCHLPHGGGKQDLEFSLAVLDGVEAGLVIEVVVEDFENLQSLGAVGGVNLESFFEIFHGLAVLGVDVLSLVLLVVGLVVCVLLGTGLRGDAAALIEECQAIVGVELESLLIVGTGLGSLFLVVVDDAAQSVVLGVAGVFLNTFVEVV